jgi:hypothetical protein
MPPLLCPSRVAGGFRPEIPKRWPAVLRALISACWAQEAAARPDFCTILEALQEVGPLAGGGEGRRGGWAGGDGSGGGQEGGYPAPAPAPAPVGVCPLRCHAGPPRCKPICSTSPTPFTRTANPQIKASSAMHKLDAMYWGKGCSFL